MRNRSLTLRFPADAQYLVLARLALTGLSSAAGLDPEILADLKLAVTEACANAVRHAYSDATSGNITVSFELNPGSIYVTIDDDGVGFEAPTSESQVPIDEDHGMGLSIIRAIADDVQIRGGENGRGTSLRLLKTLPGE